MYFIPHWILNRCSIALGFIKPMRPKLLRIGWTRHQSTPLYVYIQNIKLVWNPGTLCARLEQENVLYTPPNTKSMGDCLRLFKSRRPKLLQIWQTKHQSTPLYLYIQNIKLVWNPGTLCAGLVWENVVYTKLNTKSMVNRLSSFKPTTPKLLQIGQTKHLSQLHSMCTFRISNWFGTLVHSVPD